MDWIVEKPEQEILEVGALPFHDPIKTFQQSMISTFVACGRGWVL
jgi:hypothetical protein